MYWGIAIRTSGTDALHPGRIDSGWVGLLVPIRSGPSPPEPGGGGNDFPDQIAELQHLMHGDCR